MIPGESVAAMIALFGLMGFLGVLLLGLVGRLLIKATLP